MALGGRPLVVQGDPCSLGDGELSAVDLCLAVEDPEQGRLAGTVGAGQRDTVAPLDLERDVVEERIAGELLAEACSGHHGHSPKRRGAEAWRSRGTRCVLV